MPISLPCTELPLYVVNKYLVIKLANHTIDNTADAGTVSILSFKNLI